MARAFERSVVDSGEAQFCSDVHKHLAIIHIYRFMWMGLREVQRQTPDFMVRLAHVHIVRDDHEIGELAESELANPVLREPLPFVTDESHLQFVDLLHVLEEGDVLWPNDGLIERVIAQIRNGKRPR